MKEIYANIQDLLNKIYYEDHQWNIYADQKVVAMLNRLQGGHIKYFCSLCEWEEPREGQALPCKAMATLRRNNSRPEECSTLSLVNKINIYLSPLHTNLD
jgi:hypothetical protein